MMAESVHFGNTSSCLFNHDRRAQDPEKETEERQLQVSLGVRSDRTDRYRSSVISKVRSSKNGDRSVSFKTQDRTSLVSVSSVRSRS
jgi:hypothetical protein